MLRNLRSAVCAVTWSAVAVSSAIFAGNAIAQSIPKEGRYDYTACWSGVSTTIAYSKTHGAFSYEMTGSVRSSPPGGLFDNSTFRCVGTNADMGGKLSQLTICEALDPDGDKRLTSFTLQDGKVVRQHIAGTGKWDGATFTGSTVDTLGPFPEIKSGTFQNCNRQTGSYKLK